MPAHLPYGRQTIDDDDIAAVAAAMRADMLTTGPLVEKFEKSFAKNTSASNAVACNSGTAALHLAALSIGLGPGDSAIVPAITFLATANAVRMTGAEVVFADVDPDSGLLTPRSFQAAYLRATNEGKSVKAAFPVHLNGQICDMEELASVATSKNIALVEDACHALGVPDVGATLHSAAACFSLHPVKAITTGEGGAVTSSDGLIASRARELRNHGIVRDPKRFKNTAGFDNGKPNPWYYEMSEMGWNYRLPDLLCALGLSQLKKLPRFWRRRCEIASLYDHLLAPLVPMLRPVSRVSENNGWHLYAVIIDFARLGMTRAKLMNAMHEEGIGTQVHYVPVHLQPYYQRRYGSLALPGAESYYAGCLSLPMFPAMSNADVSRVADSLSRLLCRS